TAVDEQPSLRLEVALHRLVEVEVVLAQVREDERRESHPVEAAELRSVRGRLHRAAAVAGVEHLAEGALDVDRLGGRTDRGTALAPDAALDRAEQPGTAAGGGKDRVEQERGRRLPVRAGDARDLQLLARPAEELLGEGRHGAANIGDDELWDVEVDRALDDQRYGAVRDGVRSEVVPVGARARDAEEQRAGPGRAGVVGEVADLHGGASQD